MEKPECQTCHRDDTYRKGMCCACYFAQYRGVLDKRLRRLRGTTDWDAISWQKVVDSAQAVR